MSDDPRLGTLLKNDDSGDIVLLGFPHDEGVRRNGGRVGARGGPAAFRERIVKVGALNNLEYDIDISGLAVSDGGDVDPGLNLEDAHSALTARVKELVAGGKIPFVVGGGNDQSYANVSGLMSVMQDQEKTGLGVINLDAHLDVRPLKEGKVHSGSPFRLMMTDDRWGPLKGQFVEFALQGSQCSAEHAKWAEAQGARLMWLKEVQYSGAAAAFKDVLRGFRENGAEKVFVSFDLDCVKSDDAPGVSAPATVGLSAQDAIDICFAAGADPRVALFDLSEFNPGEENVRTVRLVTNMFYYFLLGYATRT